jgi:tetratricopeptide (TPR) repeat protein
MAEVVADRKSGIGGLLSGSAGALLLVVLVVVCYAYTSKFSYIWDDDSYIVNNTYLRDLGGLSRMWTTIGATPQYYPVTFTSFWIEYQLFGLNPTVSHVVNFLLHAASVVLLWKILQGLKVPGAWLAAAIFAVHPINVESVAWIAERKNTLSLAFGMAALLVYLRYIGLIEKPHRAPESKDDEAEDEGGVDLSLPDDPRRLYGLFLILYVCALLSKTTLAVLPGVVLVIVWWKRGRLCMKDVVPMIAPIALAAAAGLLTSWIERHPFIVGATGQPWAYGPLDRIVLAGQVSWFYVGKLLTAHPFAWGLPEGMQMATPPATVISVPEGLRAILPQGLMFNYPRWTLNAASPIQWAGTIGVLAVVAVLFLQRNRFGRGALACVLIYLGCLVPAMGFANVYPMRFSWVADHFAYVASIGLIVLFAAGAARLLGRLAVAPVLGVVLIGVLSVFTIVHSLSFRDLRRLWTDTLIRNGDSWLSATNLGAWFRGEADRMATEALPVAQDREQAMKAIQTYNTAAAKWLGTAAEMNPDAWEVPFQQAMAALGEARLKLMQVPQARAANDEARARQYTDDVARLRQSAIALAMKSEQIAAEQGIRQFAFPKFLLASLYAQQGDRDAALQVYHDLQTLEPHMSDKMPTTFAEARMKAAMMKLADVRTPAGQKLTDAEMRTVGAVIEDLSIAIQIAPRLSEPKIELARLLIKLGRTEDAAELVNQVLTDDKQNADAMYVTAEALLQTGNPTWAGKQLTELIAIRPDYFPARLLLAKVLIKMDRKDDAIAELRTLVRMQPGNTEARAMLAELGASTTQPTTAPTSTAPAPTGPSTAPAPQAN